MSDEQMSTVKKLLTQAQEKEHVQELTAEEEAEYKKAIQKLFDTPEGILFGRMLIKQTGIHSDKLCGNPTRMVEENAVKVVYNRLVRKYLDKEQIIKLEI